MISFTVYIVLTLLKAKIQTNKKSKDTFYCWMSRKALHLMDFLNAAKKETKTTICFFPLLS